MVSRRRLLAFSAACVTALAIGDDAWAAGPTATADPSPDPPSHLDYEDETIAVSVDLRRVQDVTDLRYMITNRTSEAQNYRLSYIDGKTNRESRPRTFALDPDGTMAVDLYGGLNRSFLVRICPSAATECLQLGPVALESTVSSAKPMGIRTIR
ncbi:MAG: hypothetical protein HOV83_35160 [Catenulispora sp.]|nr:hypothetical protein [Catenulispora sp.]